MSFQVQNQCYLYNPESKTFFAHGHLQLRREKFAIVPFAKDGVKCYVVIIVFKLVFQFNITRLVVRME